MKTILPWGIAVALAAILVWQVVARRTAVDEAAKAAEAVELKAQRFQVADQAKGKALEAKAAELDGLRGEIARLRAASPGVKVRTVIRWRTAYIPAGGAARPPEATWAPPIECLLARGDLGQVRVDAIRAETRKGNLVAIGRADAVRVQPAPESVLFGGPFEATLSSYTEAVTTAATTWSLGAGGWWTNPGWTTEIRGSYRISGPLWLDAAARLDNEYSLGIRWEIR